MPEIAKYLRAKCDDPSIQAGDDVLSSLARNRLALAKCSKKHGELVQFYDALRKGLK